MTETIIAWFTSLGTPATGLTPKISIWKAADNTQTVNEANMSEIAGGIYKYSYAADTDTEYVLWCDGGASLPSTERYSFGTIGTDADINADVTLIKKILRNKLVLNDGSDGNWVLYDDDSTTPLLTFSVTDKQGGPVSLANSAPARRSRGV